MTCATWAEKESKRLQGQSQNRLPAFKANETTCELGIIAPLTEYSLVPPTTGNGVYVREDCIPSSETI